MSTATAPRGLHRSLCRELPALVFMSALAVRADTAVTPGELDRFDAQKTSAVLSDGETLAYMDAGTRDGSPLVLIHGYTDSARDWAPLVPLLAGEFRLIIIDLRGHGASSKPECCYTRCTSRQPILSATHSAASSRRRLPRSGRPRRGAWSWSRPQARPLRGAAVAAHSPVLSQAVSTWRLSRN